MDGGTESHRTASPERYPPAGGAAVGRRGRSTRLQATLQEELGPPLHLRCERKHRLELDGLLQQTARSGAASAGRTTGTDFRGYMDSAHRRTPAPPSSH